MALKLMFLYMSVLMFILMLYVIIKLTSILI